MRRDESSNGLGHLAGLMVTPQLMRRAVRRLIVRSIRVLSLLIGAMMPATPSWAQAVRQPCAELSARDTVRYTSQTYTGTLALLYCSESFVDSIDVRFGVHAVPGGLVYLPVTQTGTEEFPGRGWRLGDPLEVVPVIDFTALTFFDGQAATPLADLIPHYHRFFSSPVIIEAVLYYWGVRAGSGGVYTISAIRFDFANRTAQEMTLELETEFRTDNPGYLEPPRRVEAGILYRTGRHRWVVHSNWSEFAR